MQAELEKKRPSSTATHKHKHTPEKEVSDLTNRMKRTDTKGFSIQPDIYGNAITGGHSLRQLLFAHFHTKRSGPKSLTVSK
jgi:hypothetical protein